MLRPPSTMASDPSRSSQVEPPTLRRLLEETQVREGPLRQVIHQTEQPYGCSLENLEVRVAQGEG